MPPSAPAGAPIGWHQRADGQWVQTAVPPAPGWWLASDLRWYPPKDAAPAGAEWRRSWWGLGDVWWGVLVYALASVAASVVLALGLAAANPDVALEDIEFGPYTISIGVLANVLAFAGVPWLASRRKGLGSLAADFGLRVRWVDLAIGLGLGLAALVVGGGVAAGLDAALDADGDASNVPVDDLSGPGQIIAFTLAVAVVTPIIEELFFRGLLHRSLLKRGAGRVLAGVVTTVVFVLPHLLAAPGWPEIVVLAAVITVYGGFFQLACSLTSNRLGAPIVAHAIVNGTAVLVLALG